MQYLCELVSLNLWTSSCALATAASQPKAALGGLGPKRISVDCNGLCLGHGCRSHRFFGSTMDSAVGGFPTPPDSKHQLLKLSTANGSSGSDGLIGRLQRLVGL